MSEAAVEIEGLTKVYRSKAGLVTAVENLSLRIEAGQIFGLLGPNGAGKTSTVRMVCGLIGPTRGSVRIEGISVRDQPNEVRRRIGLLPEDAGDYKNLTLIEELEYHGALHGLDRETVRKRSVPLLRRLGLEERAGFRLQTFSRGMRRKFHLIRVLLHEPRLLLLDEPTAGLDPAIVEEVWDLLKSLVAEHRVTVIICSHHLEEVERLCSRVAILRRTLLVEGSLAELSGGNNRYRMEVVGDAGGLVSVVSGAAGVSEAGAENSTLRFAVTEPAEVVPEVARRVVAAGGRMLSLTKDGRDLRKLYHSVVGGDGKGS